MRCLPLFALNWVLLFLCSQPGIRLLTTCSVYAADHATNVATLQEEVDLKELAASLWLSAGAFGNTQQANASCRLEGGEVVMQLPPLAPGEYCDGFRSPIILEPPEDYDSCEAQVTIHAEATGAQGEKDFLHILNYYGTSPPRVAVTNGPSEYTFAMGRLSQKTRYVLRLLAQNPDGERTLSLTFRIRRVIIKYGLTDAPLRVRRDVDVSSWIKQFKFDKGTLADNKANEVRNEANRDGSAFLSLPPMAANEYSRGFQWAVRMPVSETSKVDLSYIVIQAEIQGAAGVKDFIQLLDKQGRLVELHYLSNGTQLYRLEMTEAFRDNGYTLVLGAQNAAAARLAPLTCKITRVTVEYHDTVRTHHLSHSVLPGFARRVRLNRGNLNNALVTQCAVHQEGDDGPAVLQVPPMGGGTYSEGFEFSVALAPPRAFKQWVAYLLVTADCNGGMPPKDIIATTYPDGQLIERLSVVDGTGDYAAFLGAGTSASTSRRAFLLMQVPSSQRGMPLRLTVRRLAIAYYDVTARTEMFIRNCDPVAYQRSGSDFAGQQHSNERLGEQHVRAADYDFEAIESAESDMRGVNRGQALQYLFKSITPATGPPSAIHLAVLKFLHKVSVSTGLQPMHRDGSLVTDPLMLLSQSEMACGQVNGLGVDLMAAGGFRGRKVQVGRHVLAEIQYEDSWHYLDGLIFGNGDCVRSPKGGIPSIEELSRTPFTIDALPAYLEGPSLQMNPQIYPSWLYFSRQAYGDTVSAVYVKEDTLESPWLRSYGWDTVKTIPDTSRTLGDFQCLHIPGSVLFQDVKVKHRREDRVSVLLEWGVAVDPDGDLQGYRVYVSKLSRNWHKNIAEDRLGPSPFHSLQTYWRPEMYECLFQEPPHDLGLFVTAIPRIELELPIGRTSYVTVMPFDAHGESVGKRIYQPSEELCFTPDTLRSLSHASLGASSVPSSHGRSAAWAAAILACLALGIWLHVKRLRQRRAREGK